MKTGRTLVRAQAVGDWAGEQRVQKTEEGRGRDHAVHSLQQAVLELSL